MWWSNDFGFNLSFNFIQGKAEEQAVTHVIPIWTWQTTLDSDVCTLLYIYVFAVTTRELMTMLISRLT